MKAKIGWRAPSHAASVTDPSIRFRIGERIVAICQQTVYASGMVKEAFGEILRRGRLKKGLSLRQLAEETGLDYSRLSRIEHGTRPAPDLGIVRGLARSLDLDLVELLVSTGTAREVVEDLLWAERLSLGDALSELAAYRPDDSALVRKNRFEVAVVEREGARCRVRIGEALLTVFSFSKKNRLTVEIPPESVLLFHASPIALLGRDENLVQMRVQRVRQLGDVENVVLEGRGFSLNALESSGTTGCAERQAGQELFVLIPAAAIRTQPAE
jgi:transcriptional regulator with XRE-family HTH domain